MAKKKHTAKRAKANPPKPTKAPEATGGGGADDKHAAPANMDSSAGKFSPLGDPAKHSKRYENVRDVMIDECRWIINLLRESGESEESLLEQAKGMAHGLKDRAQKTAFEEGIIERIISGELFESNQSKLVRAVLQRLDHQARQPQDNAKSNLPGLRMIPSTSKAAQSELAQITAQFISTKHIKEKHVWPWLADLVKTEGFQERWKSLFRQPDRPHDRTQFEFCLSRLIALDEQMTLFARKIGPPNLFTSVEEFKCAADNFIQEVRTWSPALAGVLVQVQPWFEEATKHPYYRVTLDAWQLKRMGEPEHCIDLVMPFVLEEWSAFKKPNRERIKQTRKEPASMESRLRNCVKTIYHEFRSPPITRDSKSWIIPKHTGKATT